VPNTHGKLTIPTAPDHHKQAFWLSDYITTCLKTLLYIWLWFKYGITHAHRETIIHRRYHNIEKKNRVSIEASGEPSNSRSRGRSLTACARKWLDSQPKFQVNATITAQPIIWSSHNLTIPQLHYYFDFFIKNHKEKDALATNTYTSNHFQLAYIPTDPVTELSAGNEFFGMTI